MIYHLVSWTQHPDMSKRNEQMRFSVRLAVYAAKIFPDANIQILSNLNSPKAYWVDNFESLGAWEAAEHELNQDEGWLALGAEGLEKGLFAADQTHSFFRVES